MRLQRLDQCSVADLRYEIYMLGYDSDQDTASAGGVTALDADRYATIIAQPCDVLQEQSRFPELFGSGGGLACTSCNQHAWASYLETRGIANADHRACILRLLMSLQIRGVRVKRFLPAPAAAQPQEWPLNLAAPVPPAPPSPPRIILLSTGALNPVHLGHVSVMHRARAHMTSLGFHVVAAFLSPTHDDYVRPKMQRQVLFIWLHQFIFQPREPSSPPLTRPPPQISKQSAVTLDMVFASGHHRHAMAAGACVGSSWLSAAAWEVAPAAASRLHSRAHAP